MADCCGTTNHGSAGFDGTDPRYRRVLWTVIAINAAMFITETVAGRLAGSQALQADARLLQADIASFGQALRHPLDSALPSLIIPLATMLMGFLKKKGEAK